MLKKKELTQAQIHAHKEINEKKEREKKLRQT